MLKVSFGRLKLTCDTRSIHLDYTLELLWHGRKRKHSLRNEKLKANRASETEEQRKERLRIRCEIDRARRRTKKLQEGKKRSSETKDHEKQCLAILKRVKRCDENELERKLRLENVVASKQLRLAVETEEERRARLENDAATKQLRFAMETDEERKARLEKMSYQTAQVGRGDGEEQNWRRW